MARPVGPAERLAEVGAAAPRVGGGPGGGACSCWSGARRRRSRANGAGPPAGGRGTGPPGRSDGRGPGGGGPGRGPAGDRTNLAEYRVLSPATGADANWRPGRSTRRAGLHASAGAARRTTRPPRPRLAAYLPDCRPAEAALRPAGPARPARRGRLPRRCGAVLENPAEPPGRRLRGRAACAWPGWPRPTRGGQAPPRRPSPASRAGRGVAGRRRLGRGPRPGRRPLPGAGLARYHDARGRVDGGSWGSTELAAEAPGSDVTARLLARYADPAARTGRVSRSSPTPAAVADFAPALARNRGDSTPAITSELIEPAAPDGRTGYGGSGGDRRGGRRTSPPAPSRRPATEPGRRPGCRRTRRAGCGRGSPRPPVAAAVGADDLGRGGGRTPPPCC